MSKKRSITKNLYVVLPDGRKIRRSTTVRTEDGTMVLHIDNLIMPPSCFRHEAVYETDEPKES